ncbi:hypothetical protein MQE36_10700 [Zhouia spongiae]|uniref:Heavy-metal-associated domain-containing protein n=1 Tax=Zhouia spongiae TaxID=2202721 RepID=A0ABY3YI85_9FLAO|nr:hypothetical protein [Zhouia spongiae]UNY97552.1 hypothetical protein MQE36_10700 [Zhouia spongiae]
MKTVLVFKTSVQNKKTIKNRIKKLLNEITDNPRSWNFDLEDQDNILRIESESIKPEEIIHPLLQAGFYCEELID